MPAVGAPARFDGQQVSHALDVVFCDAGNDIVQNRKVARQGR
jgi:hypothetical protein